MKKCRINRLISIFTLVILLVCILFAYSQFENYAVSDYQYNQMYNESIQDRDIYVKSLLQANESKASMVMNIYAGKVKGDILDTYGSNLKTLQNDIIVPSKSSLLSKVFDEDLGEVYINENTDMNKAFVSSMNNILWSRSELVSAEPNKDGFYTWHDLTKDHYNKKLANQAVAALKNTDYSTDNIIFWQNTPFADSGDYQIKDMNIEALLQMYNEMGITAFKNCEMLVPAYITKNGDIFNTEDINALGERVENYKIIIILRVNMYDALKPYMGSIQYYTNQINNAHTLVISNQKQKLYIMVAALIFSICIIIGSAYIQNRIVTEESNEQNRETNQET